jgi:hypothetical protein
VWAETLLKREFLTKKMQVMAAKLGSTVRDFLISEVYGYYKKQVLEKETSHNSSDMSGEDGERNSEESGKGEGDNLNNNSISSSVSGKGSITGRGRRGFSGSRKSSGGVEGKNGCTTGMTKANLTTSPEKGALALLTAPLSRVSMLLAAEGKV